MAFTAFKDISDLILGAVTSFSGVSSTVMGWVTAPILAGLTIMIMWHGYNIIRGAGGTHHFLDIFFKSLRAFLVFTLCLGAANYTNNVQGLFVDLRGGLTALFAGGGGNSYAAKYGS
jgi:type IV secretion system protein VirB6